MRPLSLQRRFPGLAREWHPTKNLPARPTDVAGKSRLRAWWRCPKDPSHEWQTTINARAQGRGCPVCARRRLLPSDTLRARRPDVAKQWDVERNQPRRPDGVAWDGTRRVWWRCARSPDHRWRAPVRARTVDRKGCPICAALVPPRNSLRGTHAALAAEWHRRLNGSLTPAQVTASTRKTVWWSCACGHAWRAGIVTRAANRSGCPACAKRARREAAERARERARAARPSLLKLRPKIAREWHPTRNASLRPAEVAPFSARRAWWRCSVDPNHEWQAAIGNRTQGAGCPMCSGRVPTPATSLAAIFPGTASEWHRTKNGDLTPSDVSPGSGRKVWWRCSKDRSHEWRTAVKLRALGGTGCPTCAGRRASPLTCLRATHPELAREWHPTANGALTPDNVVAGSARRVRWRCRADGFEWTTAIEHRTREGTGCPACSGRVATLKTSLRACFPKIAAEWHPTKNGRLWPDDVTRATARKVWWRCALNRHHVWEATVGSRTLQGHGCPDCARSRPRLRRRRARVSVPNLVG